MKKVWLITGLVCVSGAVAAALILMYSLPLDFKERSPHQPLGFSHKLHAGTNGIPCLYCHRTATDSGLAGIPSVSDCRACHLYISPEAPEVRKLTEYWDRREPIPWVRVNGLPDHVYFTHKKHIRAGIDCTACHGGVAAMERISRTASLKASIDCWTCHI